MIVRKRLIDNRRRVCSVSGGGSGLSSQLLSLSSLRTSDYRHIGNRLNSADIIAYQSGNTLTQSGH